jgi:hypothetical protein
MTQRPSLFRQEALEFHAGRSRPGGVLRMDPPWTGWLYWIVLALLVASVTFSATARVSETTSGPALINVQERTFVALVPGAASPDLQRGQLVRLQVDGPEGPPLAARVVRAKAAGQAGIRQAGFASSSQPAMLVMGILAPHANATSVPSSPRRQGRAVVVLGSQSILDLLFQDLSGTMGEGGGS